MNTFHSQGLDMNLMYEDLARAHSRERLERARHARQADHLHRHQRLARRAERAANAVKLHLARSF